MEYKEIWEYSIYFKNGEEYFTEYESEFELIRQDNEEKIESIYYKQYVYNYDTENYEEKECIVIK